jgi:hypothetical protein
MLAAFAIKLEDVDRGEVFLRHDLGQRDRRHRLVDFEIAVVVVGIGDALLVARKHYRAADPSGTAVGQAFENDEIDVLPAALLAEIVEKAVLRRHRLVMDGDVLDLARARGRNIAILLHRFEGDDFCSGKVGVHQQRHLADVGADLDDGVDVLALRPGDEIADRREFVAIVPFHASLVARMERSKIRDSLRRL